jgi:hypothetical protein
VNRANGRGIEAFPARNGASLAGQLEVLVRTAIEHADGKARAAFYLADAAARELHHIVGMPQAYARHVNGFVISTHSLACGLAAATRQSVITPDVSAEPRWKPWLWLAEEWDLEKLGSGNMIRRLEEGQPGLRQGRAVHRGHCRNQIQPAPVPQTPHCTAGSCR